ncbi:MAG: hypothetical protein AAF762_10190 [Pseudomonadota bacterium]
MKRLAILALALVLPHGAEACVAGTKCVTVPKSQIAPPKWVPGDVLEPGSFTMIMNSTFYGLPRSDGSTWYVRIEDRALKIDPQTYVVIEDVTHLTNRSF